MPSSKPRLGEKVILKGEGNRWQGLQFSATVVDVRESDNTVKVQYTDGGFKRFPAAVYTKLLSEDTVASGDKSLSTLRSYELSDDVYSPEEFTVGDDMARLRAALNAKLQKGDFLGADKLKLDIIRHKELFMQLKAEQRQLLAMIDNEDFEACHRIQENIKGIQTELGMEKTAKAIEPLNRAEIFQKAKNRALSGGAAGALAMFLQVGSLMWMRTTMNYQYRYGVTTSEAIKILYKDGGILRFYRGVAPALFQGPLSRFGDAAANAGVLTYLNSTPSTVDWPVAVKTLFASSAAATWRIALTPIDTFKTTLQVEGSKGVGLLTARLRAEGPKTLFRGALASSGATFAGHYPWFATYNQLSHMIPEPEDKLKKLGRNAFMGFTSSVVSDTVSNSMRVIKTYKMTHEDVKMTYRKAVTEIVEKNGVADLFGRGLKTRVMTNGIQGLMFSVLWKYFEAPIQKMLNKEE
jgi:hypothetical protein